jgi:hypothetical protein
VDSHENKPHDPADVSHILLKQKERDSYLEAKRTVISIYTQNKGSFRSIRIRTESRIPTAHKTTVIILESDAIIRRMDIGFVVLIFALTAKEVCSLVGVFSAVVLGRLRTGARDRVILMLCVGSKSFMYNGTVVGIGPGTAVGVFKLDGNGNLLDGVAASSLNGSVASGSFLEPTP